MPLGTARDHHFAFDGGFAALAAGAEHFVKVQVAVKPRHTVVLLRCVRESFGTAGLGFLIEGNAFESSVAVETDKAFRVEPASTGGHDLSGDTVGA